MTTNETIRNAELYLRIAIDAAVQTHDWASSNLLAAALQMTAKARETTIQSAIASCDAFVESLRQG